MESLLATDTNGNGLIKYSVSGNSGIWRDGFLTDDYYALLAVPLRQSEKSQSKNHGQTVSVRRPL